MRKNKTTEAAFKCYAVDRRSEDKGFEGALEYDSLSCKAMEALQKLIDENMSDKTEEAGKKLADCYFYANKAGFYAGFEMAMDLFTAAKRQTGETSKAE